MAQASSRNMRTYTANDKGKGTSGDPTRLKVPMRRIGAEELVVSMKFQ